MNFSSFSRRHNGPGPDDVKQMLRLLSVNSLEQLIDQTIPANIRLKKDLNLPPEMPEPDYLSHIRRIASKNKLYKSFIGLGYYNCHTPSPIRRNIFENPGWYTAYTPYQAEIAQGRLEALINYQTMIIDLTGLPIANASLLDEATAAAEVMNMFYNARSKESVKTNSNVFFVDQNCFPQTIDVLKTRSSPLGIELVSGDFLNLEFNPKIFGCYIQYPASDGKINNYREFVKKAHLNGALVGVGADLLSLALLTPPGEWGADAVVGNSQRFGVPMGYGGPHAAFFATKEDFKRLIPGRIIGLTVDSNGNPAYRMALQTREQHIRRDKATSNICTAQALLAIMAGMYAVYHGQEGIREIAATINQKTKILAENLKSLGFEIKNEFFFDTIKIGIGNSGKTLAEIHKNAIEQQLNFYYDKDYLQLSLDETTTLSDIEKVVSVFGNSSADLTVSSSGSIPGELQRTTSFLHSRVFSEHHSETELMRYIKHLENKDLSLTHSMIPLGSCTMKLNAASELYPVSFPHFASIHPFVPVDQAMGYQEIFSELNKALCEITGFSEFSFQPNSGAQGEYAGLLVIKEYHKSRGEENRNIALIPSSAHGTNPASAAIAGMKVIVVKCDDKGNVDLEDLKSKATQYQNDLSCLMITYPSTHGVYEERIVEIIELVHSFGGQVYMDGANMNAQVGLTSPGSIGADVCHLNLHKTFAIPHGGGGPGMGPIGVAAHLKPFLPDHPVIKTGGEKGIPAVSAAPWGSASILLISYGYIKLLGAQGVKLASQLAILNANYLKTRLEQYFPILYIGKNGRVAHEMILDCREFKKTAEIEVEDIAKRLMDYGFHAPTVSFPVAGTLMIEPTESESKAELDRFAEALINIRLEIKEIEDGVYPADNNVLKNAPHTAESIIRDGFNKPYSGEKAVYPLKWVASNKFWPSVGRADSAYGDRNLVCSCAGIENFLPQTEEVI